VEQDRQEPRKLLRQDQKGIYICHEHKNKNGEPYTTTSSREFTDHIMQVHNEPIWRQLRVARERKKLLPRKALKM
jgi:hypothetical protein